MHHVDQVHAIEAIEIRFDAFARVVGPATVLLRCFIRYQDAACRLETRRIAGPSLAYPHSLYPLLCRR